MISVIAALGEGNEIGRAGGMPWQLPEDLARFKRLTMGKTMVMGRKTFASLPGVLPGRIHWIISRDASFKKEHPRVQILRMPDWAAMAEAEQEYMVIGGGQIYAQALPYAKKMYLTRIHKRYEDADTFFPAINRTEWIRTEESGPLVSESGLVYEFIDYTRRESAFPEEEQEQTI